MPLLPASLIEPLWVEFAALVRGSGYERLASPGCSDRTIGPRLSEWAQAGIGGELLRIGLEA